MRGLPFRVTAEEIVDFFSPAASVMKADIVIEEHDTGKRTGNALVFFENEAAAARAKASLNNRNVGQRYVELYDHTEPYFANMLPFQSTESN